MVKQTLLVVAAAFVFLGGISAGLFATTNWAGPENWFGSEKPLDAVVVEKLKNELQLTPEQTARVSPIISAACANLRFISEERRAQRLALMDEISANIAPELTSGQRRRLEDLDAEWQNRPTVKRDQRIAALY
jgi:hypothetical protein